MSDSLAGIDVYGECVAAMAQALSAGDECAFRAALSGFDNVRDAEVLTGVRKVAVDLQTALARFEVDSRLIGLAQHRVPDARLRLAHVLTLTADAAHLTMDLVEQCCPLADQIAHEAEQLMLERGSASHAPEPKVTDFLQSTAKRMRAVRGKLAEVQLAQGYQDLSGQIIRSVMDLVDELERALGELVRIADPRDAAGMNSGIAARGYGPVVPGIDPGSTVGGQQDVDALLSDLGM